MRAVLTRWKSQVRIPPPNGLRQRLHTSAGYPQPSDGRKAPPKGATMPRYPKLWYRESTGWWMAKIDRKQEKLVEGPQTEAMLKRAMARLGELLRFKELTRLPIPAS